MKPNFALNLTDDRISLLHRKEQGWASLGTALFGADDMDAQLAAALEAAHALGQRGAITTKIVIPNSQILYTTLQIAPGPDAARRDDIRAALAGRTPYAIEDLVFDYAGDGPEVQVAVVAQETLDQAEGFGVQYQFRPVCFVAIPQDGAFPAEPYFGLTKAAPALLGKGRRVQRDAEAITLLADEPAAPPPARAAEDPPFSAFPEADETVVPVVAAPEAGPADAPEITAEPVQSALTSSERAAEAPPFDFTLPPQPVPKSAPEPEPEPTPEPAAAAVAAAAPDHVAPAQDLSSVAHPSVPDADEAPFADVSDTDAAAAAKDDDLPPAPSTAALMAFASRRAAAAGNTSPMVGAKTLPPRPMGDTTIPGPVAERPIAERPASRPQGNMRPEPRVSYSGAVPAPPVPGAKKARKAVVGGAAASIAAATTAVPEPPRKPLTKPGGTFAASSPVRGKPRFLGLILTGILILFLALLAAWSSFFLASRSDPGSAAPTAVATIAPDTPAPDTPAALDEAMADGQDAATIVLDDPVAATSVTAPAAQIAAGPDPADPAATPTDIAAAEAAGPAPETGVVTTAPAPDAPDAQDDEIRLSTADVPLALQEAAVLAAPELQGDTVPAAQMAPPPFGTEYTFNANGTIRAVAGGILTPDGVRLVAGPPTSVPPPRPAAIAAAVPQATPVPPAAPGETDAVGSDPALADARPRARPASLVVPAVVPGSDDDTALQTETPVLASSPRPMARPAAIVAANAEPTPLRVSDAASLAAASAAAGTAAEAIIQDLAVADPATITPSGSRLAVSVSRIPAPRPRDMERAVAAALAAATRAPEPEPEPEPEPQQTAAATPEAEPEPEVEAPVAAAPTSGSVADQATFVNALSLSRINLIGVYGSQSNRYALIRQSNGRYKRVEVGDRIDGGVVAAITASEVRYQKGGRLIALQMPEG